MSHPHGTRDTHPDEQERPHGHEHAAHPSHEPPADGTTEAEHWEAFYRESERHWSGSVNATFATVVADLPTGSALDLGCGEGADAVWLAARGWQVTAVDVSATALARGHAHALDAGVADRITWEQHDLGETFPAGAFDLVSAQFLHSTLRPDRSGLLRRAANSVAPGGTLLLISHGPSSHVQSHPDVVLHTAEQTLDQLRLDPDEWDVVATTSVRRETAWPDGSLRTLDDEVVQVSRRPARPPRPAAS